MSFTWQLLYVIDDSLFGCTEHVVCNAIECCGKRMYVFPVERSNEVAAEFNNQFMGKHVIFMLQFF